MPREYDPTCGCAGKLKAPLLTRMKSLTSSWDRNNADLFALLRLSIPVSANYLLNRLVGFTSILFVGHLGPAELAAAALGGSLTNVIGLGIAGGLVGGMSTLCGQASFCSAIFLVFCKKRKPLLISSVQTAVIQHITFILQAASPPCCVPFAVVHSA